MQGKQDEGIRFLTEEMANWKVNPLLVAIPKGLFATTDYPRMCVRARARVCVCA
jgi:hypothetical protein